MTSVPACRGSEEGRTQDQSQDRARVSADALTGCVHGRNPVLDLCHTYCGLLLSGTGKMSLLMTAGHRLCRGAHGFVQRAIDMQTGEEVACKFIERGRKWKPKHLLR